MFSGRKFCFTPSNSNGAIKNSKKPHANQHNMIILEHNRFAVIAKNKINNSTVLHDLGE